MDTIAKLDEDRRLVRGWASVVSKDGIPLIDQQGDVIPAQVLEDAAYKFVADSRKTNVMHRGPATGEIVESFVATPEKYAAMGIPAEVSKALPVGLWITAKVDKPTFARVKSGELKMFSIEGRAKKRLVEQ